jgi:hypothetical protein
MNEIKLKTDLVNAILQYLGSRPYVETFQLISAIQKEAEAQSATETQAKYLITKTNQQENKKHLV